MKYVITYKLEQGRACYWYYQDGRSVRGEFEDASSETSSDTLRQRAETRASEWGHLDVEVMPAEDFTPAAHLDDSPRTRRTGNTWAVGGFETDGPPSGFYPA